MLRLVKVKVPSNNILFSLNQKYVGGTLVVNFFALFIVYMIGWDYYFLALLWIPLSHSVFFPKILKNYFDIETERIFDLLSFRAIIPFR